LDFLTVQQPPSIKKLAGRLMLFAATEKSFMAKSLEVALIYAELAFVSLAKDGRGY
jgi:hypothetical protein